MGSYTARIYLLGRCSEGPLVGKFPRTLKSVPVVKKATGGKRLSLPRDTEFAHAGDQRRSRQPEFRGRATTTPDYPVRPSERFGDGTPFKFLQCADGMGGPLLNLLCECLSGRRQNFAEVSRTARSR